MGASLKNRYGWGRIAVLSALSVCACVAVAADSRDVPLYKEGFGDLSPSERRRLVDMAVCAKAAYPMHSLPPGYRAMSRDEWKALASGCPDGMYSDDGYITVWNGLRGRLMVHLESGRNVVAWSGCDNFKGNEMECVKDVITSIKHIFAGSVRSQYEQALGVCRGVVRISRGRDVWVVGHSLGGSMVTYIALALDECPEGVQFATFNGLGVSQSCLSRFGDDRRTRCTGNLVNVYCDKDLVYNFFPDDLEFLSKSDWWLMQAKPLLSNIRKQSVPEHPGRSVCIKYRLVDKDDEDDGWEASEMIIGKQMRFAYYHGINELIRQMGMQCQAVPVWRAWIWGGVGIVVAVVLVMWCFAAKRRGNGNWKGTAE